MLLQARNSLKLAAQTAGALLGFTLEPEPDDALTHTAVACLDHDCIPEADEDGDGCGIAVQGYVSGW